MKSWLSLAEWRRHTAEMYAELRRSAPDEIEESWSRWRARRDELFRSHAESPLEPLHAGRFEQLPYYPYDPRWRFLVVPQPCPPVIQPRSVALPEGKALLVPVALLPVPSPVGSVPGSEPEPAETEALLTLYWIEGYGGGLFLPFGDATNGKETYGGGRYLYDTIKGADPGAAADGFVLDFNFAYNPSCAYSPRWTCPLSPPENRLPFPVQAGEQHPAIIEAHRPGA